MEAKPFVQSKLNWLGLLMILWGVLSEPQFGTLLKDIIPPTLLPKIMSAAGILVIVLRTFFTSQGITVGKSKDDLLGLLAVVFAPLILGLLCSASSGCATTNQYPEAIPAGCEGSAYASKPQAFDQALTLMVTGAKVYALYNPAAYASIQLAAKQAANTLKGGSSNLDALSGVKGADLILTALATLYPPGQLLHKCDRDVIVRYLEMI